MQSIQEFFRELALGLAFLPVVVAAALDIMLRSPGVSVISRAAMVLTSVLLSFLVYVPVSPAPYLVNLLALTVAIFPVAFSTYWIQRRVFRIRMWLERGFDWLIYTFGSWPPAITWPPLIEWPWEKWLEARAFRSRIAKDSLTPYEVRLAARALVGAARSGAKDRKVLNRCAYNVANWLQRNPADVQIHMQMGHLATEWMARIDNMPAPELSFVRSLVCPLNLTAQHAFSATHGTPAQAMLATTTKKVFGDMSVRIDAVWMQRQSEARRRLRWRGAAILALLTAVAMAEAAAAYLNSQSGTTVLTSHVLRPVLLAWVPLGLAATLLQMSRFYLDACCVWRRWAARAAVIGFAVASYLIQACTVAAFFGTFDGTLEMAWYWVQQAFVYLNFSRLVQTPPFGDLSETLAAVTMQTDSLLALPSLYFSVLLDELSSVLAWSAARLGVPPGIGATLVMVGGGFVTFLLATALVRRTPILRNT